MCYREIFHGEYHSVPWIEPAPDTVLKQKYRTNNSSTFPAQLSYQGHEARLSNMVKMDLQKSEITTMKWLFVSILTLPVLKPGYSAIIRSISWLLMPWLLASPGHQQPWYWICRITMSLSSTDNTMAADVLAPCIASSSAAMVLNMYDNHVLVFHGQYHGCWCPGSFCCQVISSHGIEYAW